jgi:hypothetical protein
MDFLSSSYKKLTQILLLHHYRLYSTYHCSLVLFREIWKHASVVPVLKEGSPGDTCNYRRISLTCIACKLMEGGIKDALLVCNVIPLNPKRAVIVAPNYSVEGIFFAGC